MASALLLLFPLTACARMPTPAGPATLTGAVAAAGEDAPVGDAAPDAPWGPLLLRQARVQTTPGVLEWSLEVSNPSSERLGITLVLRVADGDDDVVVHDSVTFLLAGGETVRVNDFVEMDEDAARRAVNWRLESWVRRLPPAERQAPRTGD